MRPWKLLRPADWTPTSMERVLWRPPDGSEPLRAGWMIVPDVDEHHHLVGVTHRRIRADKRDVFQHWDRIEDERERARQ